MRTRRPTLGERLYEVEEFEETLAKHLSATLDYGITQIASHMWRGWDAVLASLPKDFDPTQPSDALETSISQHFAQDIRRQMTGFEPYDVIHGAHEFSTRMEGSSQAPVYDIGFVLNANRRVIWPVEAKVLATDGAVSEYIRDIREQFLTCRYAPLSRSGAMAGYLLSGSATKALTNIESKLGATLAKHPSFSQHSHRVSSHSRAGEYCASVGSEFTCHHLILVLGHAQGEAE